MPVRDQGKALTKELGRRRIYFFVAIWIAIAFVGLMMEESDKFFNALDDYAIFTIGVVSLVYLLTQRKKTSLAELKKQNKIILILFVIALIFQIYAIPTELSDAQDFGNEIPVLILLVLALLNKFV